MPASRRFVVHWLIHLTRSCAGPGSRYSDRKIAAWKLLQRDISITLGVWSVSLVFSDFRSVRPMADNCPAFTPFCQEPRWLGKALQASKWFPT